MQLASHLLGSDRAVANFGGGNTSAKGSAVDHVGRTVDVMWVKGSGSDMATMGHEHFTPLRLDEMLHGFERDAVSDEEMVAHLARCQVDPAAPHVHHTHPDGINVLAGTRDGERLVAECFGDAAVWIPTSARASRSRSRSARRCARTRRCGGRARKARTRRMGRLRRGGVPTDDPGDSTWRKERAAAYGIEPHELEEHYRRRNALKVNILPDDIAAAVLHFASETRAGKSTGNVLNVDGGVAAAFPR